MATTDTVSTVRSLMAAFDHDTLYDLSRAAADQAATLDRIDRHHPDPELRASAARLNAAADVLARAVSVSAFADDDGRA